jgi:hypothetical protein
MVACILFGVCVIYKMRRDWQKEEQTIYADDEIDEPA